MGNHQIRKGLDIPIAGAPQPVISSKPVRRVALVAVDHPGLKPRMLVQQGDPVRRGQALFEDKAVEGAFFTAPGAGTVSVVYRGERRALQSIVIDLTDTEAAERPEPSDFHSFSSYTGGPAASMANEAVRALLAESGLWTAFRTRPFSRVPQLDSAPAGIFITACDSNPLAPPMDLIADGRQAALDEGVMALTKLTDKPVFFCKHPEHRLAPTVSTSNLRIETFFGPHPSGTAGMHIHSLAPVSRTRTVWHIGLQDVLSIGDLILTGRLDVTRVIGLCGPAVRKPRLLKTRLGAALDTLVSDELEAGENRVLSGSVLSGRAASEEAFSFLGRFANQVCALREGREREFLGWLAPGTNKFSVSRLFLSRLTPSKIFGMSTDTHGSSRPIVSIGLYDRVMPMDILPTYLLRSLCVEDVEQAEKLGCLELDEEDLALCSFVDPGKTDFGPILRRNLELIQKEG